MASRTHRLATLEEALRTCSALRLRAMGRLLLAAPPMRKAELLPAILEALTDEKLRELWDRMEETDRIAVSEVVHGPGHRLDPEAFHLKYGRLSPTVAHDQYNPRVARPLNLFLFSGGRMPPDLEARLKGFVPEPASSHVETVEELPEAVPVEWCRYSPRSGRRETGVDQVPLVRQDTIAPALHDVHAVLQLAEAGKTGASAVTGKVSKAGAKAVLDVLHGGDFYPLKEVQAATDTMRPYAWPLILQAAGLLSVSGGRLRLTRAGGKALSSPPHRVIRAAWKKWLGTRLLDEFNRIEEIKGQKRKGRGGLAAVARRRTSLAAALAECPPGRWIAIDEFFRFVRASGNDFVVSHDVWSLYICERQYGSLGYDGFGTWEVVEGRYAMVFLWEYAATMGLLDVAYIPAKGARDDWTQIWGTDDMECLSRYDGLRHVRVNALGAWCLGVEKEFRPPEPEARSLLQVLPNLDVVAAAQEGLPPGDALFLERFAERSTDGVWRLDRRKALGALEAGLTGKDLETWLGARGAAPLPATVVAFLADLRHRAGRLVDRGPARLIEAADAALALLITSDRNLARLCRPAGERGIVVPSRHERAFRRGVKELGYALPPSRTGREE